MNSSPAEKLLAELVSIPSMNPMGRDLAGARYCEKYVADFIIETLRRGSIDVETYDMAPSRPNVLAYVDGGSRETLLLEAHLDTVHADGMTIDPFIPVIKDGRLYGRGSCDTKGSIAAFMQAVLFLTKSKTRLRYNVILLFVSDEEYRFGGAKAAVAKGLKASFGIVGEPTGLGIITAHKGVTRWRVTANGESAHSAYPERGRNAVYLMAEVVKRLEGHAGELARRTPHRVLGTPTLSVGRIEGGQAVNMVPDHCCIEIDRRSLPGESTADITGAVSHMLEDIDHVHMDPPYLSVAGMELPTSAPVAALLSDAVARVKGKAEIGAAHYATDAGIYHAAGIPTVVFGPGRIEQAHTAAEFISLSELEDSVAVLQHLMTSR